MKSDTPLDYAVFQLSPRRSRCELFVSSDGNTEKLASGLLKPFVTHLKVAEEQVALAVPSIKLEIERHKNAETWFSKGTLERFVRFVGTPEALEMVNTLDAETSQLEAARRIYSQGAGDQRSDAQGGNRAGATAAADATKNELLRAIDVRLTAVRQDLTAACSRALAAGFNPDTVSELQQFADRFGAYRLNEACTKFTSLYQRRPDLISPWKAGVDDRYLRSSVGSDMSIDDPTEDPSGSHVGPNHALSSDQSTSTTWQQQKSSAAFAFRRNSNGKEKDSNNANESKDDVKGKQKKEEGPTESSPPFTTPAAPPARRLSVQDRINLFENKQKENSGGSGGVLKPVVGKAVELRRLSSDVPAGPTSVAAADKSVLRRWSGASDMSIDVNGEKKDIESPLCTPSSVSQTKSDTVSDSSEDKDQRILNNSENKLDAVLKDQTDVRNWFGVSVAKGEEDGFNVISNCKDQAVSGTKLRSFVGRAEKVVKTDQFSTQETSEVSVFDEKRTEVAAQKYIDVVSSTVGDATSDVKVRREDSGVRSRLAAQSLLRASHSHSRSFSGQFEGGGGIKFDEAPSVKVEVDKSTNNKPQGRSTREIEDLLKKDTPFSSKQQTKVGDTEVPKMNYQNSNSSSREQTSKSHSKRDEIRVVYNSKLNLPGKEGVASQDSVRAASHAPLEQVLRVRQSKGNQGLNDELKMKANELEKLFAEHKMRVPGEQSGSARRIEPADLQAEPGAGEVTPQLPTRNTLLNRTGSLDNLANLDAKSLMKMVQNHFSDINFRDDSRGKFYEKYMQKRDAKLREDWSSNRAEKEARMKAMQDSLEQSRAEMKAKLSGSADRQDLVSGARQCVEKIRSFNFRSNINREQHPINSLQNEEDEDLSDFPDEKTYGGSKQSRKNLPNRNTSSTTPRTAAAASSVSRSAAKISSSSSARRRDNPLAQSVPNFSDLRKENTRPSSGVSKTTRSQVKNYSRSKSTNEEMAGIKEEKSKRAQSLQKSSANPAEFKDLSPMNSDVVLDPLKFDVDAVRLRASMASEMQKNEESDEMEFDEDFAVDTVQEEDDGIETTAIGDGTLNGKVRLSQESEKSGNSGSEIGDSTRSPTELEPVSVAEMPTAIPSSFNNVGSLQDSPVESPVSWNSRLHHPFSYPPESSDIDACVDSPIGSPAYWNSRSLAQVETDAARMRKKWGSAQKPILVANSSHNQSRKDVTKGFKRLLKFGRKNRGSESLVDWISATTSEGDDDTEDGRDPANRSSEDLRKTRMGFSQGHPSDDSFNESELFNEHVQSLRSSIPAPPAQFKLRDDHISGSSLKAPRSFFSLSSFRSKGSDTKPR